MQIQLINGYYIERDKRNYTLKQNYWGKTKEGKNKEFTKICGHHHDLEGAVKEFLTINQIAEMSKLSLDLMQYVKMVEESNKNAVRAIASVSEQALKQMGE